MTSAARTHLTPRYGSPAKVAAFLGVSSKTVLRLIDAGTVPSYRVGRRVLVAFRDADQLVRRKQAMATAHTTESEAPVIDPATGRIRPLSAEERRARSERLQRTLDALGDITDATDTDEVWANVFRDLDDDRPVGPPAAGTS